MFAILVLMCVCGWKVTLYNTMHVLLHVFCHCMSLYMESEACCESTGGSHWSLDVFFSLLQILCVHFSVMYI